MELLDQQSVVACDTEASGLDFFRDQLIGFSFALDSSDKSQSYYVPIRHQTGEKQLDPDFVLDALWEWLAKPDLTTIWHNALFDFLMLRSEGVEIGGTIHDTLVLHFLLDENGSHKLGDLAHRHLNAPAWKDVVHEELKRRARELKVKVSEVHYGHVGIPIMAEYACLDAFQTFGLWDKFQHRLAKDGFDKLYATEQELIRVLADMQFEGVLIDVKYFESLQKKTEEERERLDNKINDDAHSYLVSRPEAKELMLKLVEAKQLPQTPRNRKRLESLQKKYRAATTLNLGSPKQLREFFMDKGIPPLKYTPSGQMSVDKLTLMRLAQRGYTVAQEILDYRAKDKLVSTYIKGMLERLDSENRLHTSFNSTGAKTGRLSSSRPNLQNIPRGPEIRRAFIVPNEDFIFISIDFSQIELRLAAHYSRDHNMLEIYRNNGDIHSRTAELCNCPTRQEAKPINFGLLYGMGWKALIENAYKDYGVNFTPQQAKAHFTNFWKVAYPGLHSWVEKEKRFIRRYRYSENFFGRRRRVPEIGQRDIAEWQKEHAIRGAVNHIIQGTAADMLKIVMVRVWKFLKERNAKTKMISTIHDEICFYWHIDEFDLLKPVLDLMEDWRSCKLRVPIIADVSYSRVSWGDKKELKL